MLQQYAHGVKKPHIYCHHAEPDFVHHAEPDFVQTSIHHSQSTTMPVNLMMMMMMMMMMM